MPPKNSGGVGAGPRLVLPAIPLGAGWATPASSARACWLPRPSRPSLYLGLPRGITCGLIRGPGFSAEFVSAGAGSQGFVHRVSELQYPCLDLLVVSSGTLTDIGIFRFPNDSSHTNPHAIQRINVGYTTSWPTPVASSMIAMGASRIAAADRRVAQPNSLVQREGEGCTQPQAWIGVPVVRVSSTPVRASKRSPVPDSCTLPPHS